MHYYRHYQYQNHHNHHHHPPHHHHFDLMCFDFASALSAFTSFLLFILANDQLEAQIVMYVYFYSLHVSGSYVPSSGELLYQCDTWFMSPCVDDRLV